MRVNLGERGNTSMSGVGGFYSSYHYIKFSFHTLILFATASLYDRPCACQLQLFPWMHCPHLRPPASKNRYCWYSILHRLSTGDGCVLDLRSSGSRPLSQRLMGYGRVLRTPSKHSRDAPQRVRVRRGRFIQGRKKYSKTVSASTS